MSNNDFKTVFKRYCETKINNGKRKLDDINHKLRQKSPL